MKERIQSFGRALSAMIMPNIGAFIAWGLITAMFIPGGWWPNETVAKMVGPMLTYLLPILIAYTAGKNIGGTRGGVAGAIAVMGVIIGSDTPMFLGAMIMGPLAGWCIKKFDKLVQGKVKAGFEMLVDNFSLGIIAMLLSICGLLVVGHAVQWLTHIMGLGVDWMLEHKMNPLLALIVDPSKVLFLNNALNHGIFTPMGMMQVQDMGHSILYIVESNPGAGLGMLLACCVFGKGLTRQSAPGAVIIQAFGGIHEIYFPYVLARPMLIFPIIAGNICALSFYTIMDFGLIAPASPGSIISIVLMSPKGSTITGLLGILIAAGVTFLLSWPIIKKRPDFQNSQPQKKAKDTKDDLHLSGNLTKICFACDAGMGSSALGATRFKSRLNKAGLTEISCTNCPISDIPDDASVVVCQNELAQRAAKSGKPLVTISNFLNDPALDRLLESLVHPGHAEAPQMMPRTNIFLSLQSESKQDAIRRAGKVLESKGYTDSGYAEAMLSREDLATTCMGMGLAIPHGTEEAKAKVKHSGVVFLQYPEGIMWDENEKVRIVIGIAGKGDEHNDILAKLATAFEDNAILEALYTTTDVEDIMKILG